MAISEEQIILCCFGERQNGTVGNAFEENKLAPRTNQGPTRSKADKSI